MSYTAWEAMRQRNLSTYGIDAPQQPPDYRNKRDTGKLENACLDFIRDWCEELRFDNAHRTIDDADGRSAQAGQIPLHMERDTDRLCLENALHRFLQSGATQDAFDVYFCYLEMFVGGYARSHKMIELLAEFESNASALLMKHRDHYSHSVYVFALGLALYRSSPAFQAAYGEFYTLTEKRSAAHHFLRYWGLTSLFHDIGYPFELPFEQIKSYFNSTDGTVPFISYQGVPGYVALDEEQRSAFSTLLSWPLATGTINEVLSVRVSQMLGEAYGVSAETLKNDVLDQKASRPDRFSNFMDHAYFSAVLLLHKFMEIKGVRQITRTDLDAMTAILLHNSMFKFSLRVGVHKKQPLEMEKHPLAYLLMLCDELQCWDRTAYGQNSRRELHPMWCEFAFDGDRIQADYRYDRQLEWKKDKAKGTYPKMQGAHPAFVADIEAIVALNRPGALELEISTCFAKNERNSHAYLSDSSFMHLYDFAVALNGRYTYGTPDGVAPEQLERDFNDLSLEYKLSNILQAKAFAKYLDAIGCFYTDRPVAYEKLERFTEAHMDRIGPMEHDRWVAEKRSMGWVYGTDYLDKPEPKRVRELTRTHSLMIDDYKDLSKEEQDKDTEPMNCMLRLIEEYDGLRIYRV